MTVPFELVRFSESKVTVLLRDVATNRRWIQKSPRPENAPLEDITLCPPDKVRDETD